MKKTFLSLFTLFFFCHFVSAQLDKPIQDTDYYKSYKGTIIGRVFLLRKYEQMQLQAPSGLPKMTYHANTSLSLGLGITYRAITLNISKGLDFLKSDTRKGHTQFNDFQLRVYQRKWLVDALVDFNKGFYLSPEGLGTATGQGFYKRGDVGISMGALGIYRVLNSRRFTYGAAMAQNDWQKKSAGSFLIGGESFYVASNADSAFVPTRVDTLYSNHTKKLHLFGIGPGIGYAYTLVVHQHYFLMGSANATLEFGYSKEYGNSIGTKFGFWENYVFRIGTGYNSHKWNLGFSWIDGYINTSGGKTLYKYIYNLGNYRLVYARRFGVNYESRRMLW